ncbi:MAG: hypothetical protein V4456_05155 [Bacteroidota bacterium]
MKHFTAVFLMLLLSSFCFSPTTDLLCNKRWLQFGHRNAGRVIKDAPIILDDKSKSYEFFFNSDSTFVQTNIATKQTLRKRWILSEKNNDKSLCFIPSKEDMPANDENIFYLFNTSIEKLTPDTLVLGNYNESARAITYYQYFVRVK